MSDATGPERIWLDAKSMLLSWICVSSLTEYIRADLYEAAEAAAYPTYKRDKRIRIALERSLKESETVRGRLVADNVELKKRVEDGIEALNASERIRARLVAENIELKGRVEDERLRETANSQAEDEGLWFEAQTAPEAYLQQELRRLHEIIEGKTGDECARAVVAGYSPTPPVNVVCDKCNGDGGYYEDEVDRA